MCFRIKQVRLQSLNDVIRFVVELEVFIKLDFRRIEQKLYLCMVNGDFFRNDDVDNIDELMKCLKSLQSFLNDLKLEI